MECNKSPEQREKEKKEKIVKDSLANIEKELRNIRCYSYDAKIIAKEGDSYDAKIIAKEFVERRLLFPKSVDYGTIEAVWSDKEGCWQVGGTFTAKNSFCIETYKFICFTKKNSDGKNWTLIDLTII